MGKNASRRGAANLGTPLMIVAILVVGGFLYWLFLQSEAERELELQEAARIAAEEAEREAMGDVIDATRIQMDASPFAGRQITLEDQEVASPLGTQGVWLDMPNGNPFLVSFSDAVKADGATLRSGQLVTVSGVIRAMNDSTAGAWAASGAISEGDRLAAEFATHYMDANRVRPGDMAPPEPAADSAAAGG